MYNLEVKFRSASENEKWEIVDEIQGLLAALEKNGQILESYCPILENKEKHFEVYVLAYEETSLELENCNIHVKNAFDRLKNLNIDEIVVTSLGKYPASVLLQVKMDFKKVDMDNKTTKKGTNHVRKTQKKI